MENMENIAYNDSIMYPEYQPDGGPILYPVPSYWIEVEGIFPTVQGGTTFYPHLMYYVPVYGYETPYDTVDYGYSLSDDTTQYEDDNMLYENESTEYYSAESAEDFPWLATDTYHTSEVADFHLEPEVSNVGTEDLQRSDADFSSSAIGSDHTGGRDSELCSAGTESNILKTSFKEIGFNDFESKNVNDTVLKNFESLLNSNYEKSNDIELLACKGSESICKEINFDDIRLEDENNWATKKSDCSSNCTTHAPSKIKDNFVSQSSKRIYGKLSVEDIIVSHNDNIFEKQDLKDPLDNTESCYQSEFLASENLENACDQLNSANTISSNISNTDLQENIVTSFDSAETKLKKDVISILGFKHCSGDSVKKNDMIKNNVKKNYVKKNYVKKNDENERVFMKGFEFDCESKQWGYQRMKKFNSLGGDSSRSDDDVNFEVELLESDFDYASVETKAENDEYGEKSCLWFPDCIELTDDEVKCKKDELYLTALSGKLYRKTQIPPVEILPIIYEEEEELLCEDDEESLELQTSAVSEAEGALNCSPDLSKSVKQQKSKGKRMKNVRKFFSRIFCCVKPP